MSPRSGNWPGLLVITVFGLAAWFARVLLESPNPGVRLGNIDQHIEHLPMARYGFSTLLAGEWPLWNPYQLAGTPFFAVPLTSLLYVGNLLYWLLPVPEAIEGTAVIHVLFGGACMYGLAKQLGLGTRGATFAACVLIASGSWLFFSQQLILQRALPWLPATALGIERTLRGGRWAPLAVAACMASQALLGATELLVYNSYAAILYGAVRCCAVSVSVGPRIAVGRAAIAVVAAAAGLGIAGVQLVPSFELASLSARNEGAVELERARFLAEGASQIFSKLLSSRERAAIGLLALVGLLLGPGRGTSRSGWVAAVAIAALGFTMTTGGILYELHFETPIGRLFRFTHKWMILYGFGGALLAGYAVARLESGEVSRSRSLGTVALLVALGLLFAEPRGWWGPLLVPVLGLLAYAFIASQSFRLALVAGMALFDLGLLVTNPFPRLSRPIHIPEFSDARQKLWREMEEHVGNQRIFISPALIVSPGLTFKQGTLRGVRVSEDYEPLATARYGHYFRLASGHERRAPYAGYHRLTPKARFPWLDWTATRLYVVPEGSAEARVLRDAATDGNPRIWSRRPGLVIFDRPSALPRAWVVPRALPVASESEALAALAQPDFDPRETVVLEGAVPVERHHDSAQASRDATARFVRDETEDVELEITADEAGWLVLADAWYPGWEARVDGIPQPILRANSLFRAVRIPAGESRVSFVYRPASVRIGAAISGTSALLLVALLFLWQRRVDPSMPPAKHERHDDR